MRPTLTITVTLAIAASAVLAHTGVKNPQVLARMDGMKSMGEDPKTLGQMAKGATAYDMHLATVALASLQTQTNRIPELFAPEAHDPKSEATSTIWTDNDGFAARNAQMTTALEAADISSPETIRLSLRGIGAACSACHEDYRIKK